MRVIGDQEYLFPIDREKLRKSISVTDVYKDCGIFDLFKERGIKGDISMITMNKYTYDKLHNTLQENIRRSKDRRVSYLVEKHRLSRFAMDWLNYAPEEEEGVPDWEIKVDLKKGKGGEDVISVRGHVSGDAVDEDGV